MRLACDEAGGLATAANAGIPVAARKPARDEKIRAAGIVLVAPDGRALFLKRSAEGDHEGEWGIPGGKLDGNEKPEEAALRELEEETGIAIDPSSLREVDHTDRDGIEYTTFLARVEAPYAPRLNGEHSGHAWAPLKEPPQPAHPGLAATIKSKLAGDDGTSRKELRRAIKFPPDETVGGTRVIDAEFDRGKRKENGGGKELKMAPEARQLGQTTADDEEFDRETSMAPEAKELNSTTIDDGALDSVKGYLDFVASKHPRSAESFVLRHGRAYAAQDAAGPVEKPIEVADDPNKSEAGRHWGYHLILDLSGCNTRIDDEGSVRAFFSDLIAALKMKTIGDLIVEKVEGEEGRGLSAVQIITTSTITFHGDNEEWCVYLDVFSCLQFDPRTAIDIVKRYFEPTRIGKIWLYRDAGKWPEK